MGPAGPSPSGSHATSLLLVALTCAVAAGCTKPGVGSGWNVMEEIEAAETVAVVTPPRAAFQSPLTGVKDEDLPCLKTCHDREKWATGRPYPHLHDSHKGNGKHCVDCHAMGHKSAKADRRICKECH